MATENITDKNILKSWFKRGLKPLESQFAAWMDSYWHKSEKIPTAGVEGLENVLNQKAESAALDNLGDELAVHAADDTRHKTPEEQSQLACLAANPNATYATKGQLAEFANPFFLYHNGDGVISDEDRDDGGMPVNSPAWDEFHKALMDGKTPALYLRTPGMDTYTPASYRLSGDAEIFDGIISVQYIKENQLCTEELNFDKNHNGGFKGVGSIMVNPPETTKIPVGNEFNYLNINLGLMSEADGLETTAFKDNIEGQMARFDTNLPILAIFRKTSGLPYFVIASRFRHTHNSSQATTMIRYEIEIPINDPEIETLLRGESLNITWLRQSTGDVINFNSSDIKTALFKNARTLFLYDNSDYFISNSDIPNEVGWDRTAGKWNDFRDELKKGRLPAVYLRSPESDAFFPASYQFTPVADNPDRFKGYIEISYMKEIEGKRHLCREKRIFENSHFGGNGSIYSGTGENGSFIVEKIPLDDSVFVVTEYPEDLSTYPDGSIFIKQQP